MLLLRVSYADSEGDYVVACFFVDKGSGDGDLSSLASSAFFASISLVGISSPPYRCLLII